VAVPAPQDWIHLRKDLAQAASLGAPCQRSHFLLQFLKAFLSRPFLASVKVPAQKVEAFTRRVDDACLGRVQGQSCRSRPFAQKRQHSLGLFFRAAQHDEVVRVAHHRPAPPCHFVVQRIEVEVCQERTDHGPLRSAALRRLPASQLFQHAGFQTLFQQRQDAPVHDSLPDHRHQSFVRSSSLSRASSVTACSSNCLTVWSSTPGAPSLRQTAQKAAWRLRSDRTLSQSPNHTVVGSLCSSRVSMRSVQTECSTHHQRSRMSAACLGWLSPVTLAARLVSSFVTDFPPPLSYVPWLHGRYPASSLLRTL